MAGAQVNPDISRVHLWTGLWSANLVLELDHQEVKLDDQLLDVLVLPLILAYPLGHLADGLDVLRIRPNQLL